MTGGSWTASIDVALTEPDIAEWVTAALGPEAAREVPRARAEVAATGPGRFRIRVEARDTGALRAALNTYLGWVSLALESARVIRSPPSSEP